MLTALEITVIHNDDLTRAFNELSDTEFKVFIYCVMKCQEMSINERSAFPCISFDKLAVMLQKTVEEIPDILNNLVKKGFLSIWDYQIAHKNYYDIGISYKPVGTDRYLRSLEYDISTRKLLPILTDNMYAVLRQFAEQYRGKRPVEIEQDAKRWDKLKKQIMEILPECYVCEYNDDLDLHHHHYESFNRETAKDVVLLCTRCHKLLHQMATGKGGEGSA